MPATGQPRPVDVAQPRDVVHDLRTVQSFVADAADRHVVELFGLRIDE